MRPLTAIVGALALASFGCGDDDNNVYEDSVEDFTAEDAVEETAEVASDFTFTGGAFYCKDHEDEDSACLKFYVNMAINSEQNLSSAWLNIYADRIVKIGERRMEGTSAQYTFTNEMCIGGVGTITGIELVAEDVYAGQGKYPLTEDCETLDEMLGL